MKQCSTKAWVNEYYLNFHRMSRWVKWANLKGHLHGHFHRNVKGGIAEREQRIKDNKKRKCSLISQGCTRATNQRTPIPELTRVPLPLSALYPHKSDKKKKQKNLIQRWSWSQTRNNTKEVSERRHKMWLMTWVTSSKALSRVHGATEPGREKQMCSPSTVNSVT